ncbi:ubiquitin carboxyl-terminal hydrolase 4 [Limosa lapponica baueri]|uniref:Ubiquitin carboxyl-terminal hydrolase 4 n=1 Tax=Limosa lapponica baueri TaxID=1758121 RepID=A0A2I0T129_LIMLA|nr:ubiquitin carboxyl-terminal hydrolase 4 [Limosa lapponica baueri]
MVWDFTPKQLQDPDKVIEYLKGKCGGYSREAQLTALCWALASIYQALLNTVQHPQEKEMETRPTGSVATATSVADAVITPTPGVDTAADAVTIPTPVADTAADTASTSTPVADTAATSTPVSGAVATPTPATGNVATPTPVAGTANEPENQPVPVSVAPIQKKKHTKKSVRSVRDDDDPGPSSEQEEEVEPEIITQSLSLSELRDMQKDFS